jgi:hypothetical protein
VHTHGDEPTFTVPFRDLVVQSKTKRVVTGPFGKVIRKRREMSQIFIVLLF